MTAVEKNRELALGLASVLLEQLENGGEEEAGGTHAVRLEVRKGVTLKMTLVRLAYGLEKAHVFCGEGGHLLSYNELSDAFGRMFGVPLKNASRLKQVLLGQEDPAAFFRKIVESIDRETDRRLGVKGGK